MDAWVEGPVKVDAAAAAHLRPGHPSKLSYGPVHVLLCAAHGMSFGPCPSPGLGRGFRAQESRLQRSHQQGRIRMAVHQRSSPPPPPCTPPPRPKWPSWEKTQMQKRTKTVLQVLLPVLETVLAWYPRQYLKGMEGGRFRDRKVCIPKMAQPHFPAILYNMRVLQALEGHFISYACPLGS